jgi:hypothetical protein
MRLALGAFLGAVILFFWGAFSHMVLLKGVGFTPLPDEELVTGQLKSSVGDEGLYFFPGKDFRGTYTPEQEEAWETKFRQGPTGMLIYHPGGVSSVSQRKLLTQFLSHFLAAAIASLIVSRMIGPYWQRVLAVALFGAFACLSVGTIYWNWYGFPDSFFAAQCVDQVVGWLLAGVALVVVVPRPQPATSGSRG